MPVRAVLRPSLPDSKVVVAIPAYNEEKTIGSIVILARRHANEVVVVDDGSEDRTSWIAEQAGATVIHHQSNRGYGAALRSCFNYARANGCGVLVVLDGDGQHRPQLIPQVIEPIAAGSADVSIGSRFLSPSGHQSVPRYRKFGIGIITRLTNLGTHQNQRIKDAQSGFRAYSQAAIAAIDPRETNMGASAEILWEADRKGLRIVEVPISVDYLPAGSTHGPVQHGLSVIASMVRYVETKHALLVFALPGLVTFVGGLILGFLVLDSYYRTGVPALGLAMVTVLTTVVGLLLGFTGLILHAVINANSRTR
ncbi:MAG TPA: glycosyltransferase family 2 protein [Thermoplasmata archaeon]|nr:glycosyltransferase family 2 protein [Thermoplasmata archaeon]